MVPTSSEVLEGQKRFFAAGERAADRRRYSPADKCLQPDIEIFVRSEGECTSEIAPGQFSIFGAVEEIFAGRFAKLAQLKRSMKRTRIRA